MKTTTKFVSLVLILAAFAAVPSVCLAAGSDSFTVPSSVASQAVFSCGDMTMSGGGTIDSAGIGSSGPTNRGTIRSNGKITISSSTVNGDAIPGPGKTVSVSGSGTVSGTTTAATSALGCTPINLSALATSLASSNDNATIPLTGQAKSVLAGAAHTEFSMSGGDTLTLPAGTYYFTKFTISGGSTITLGGAVRILVTGNVNISGGSFVNSNAYSFRFWDSGTTFSLSSSTFAGIVYAPSASLTISSSRFIGTVFANAVTISGGTSHVTRSIDDVAPSVSITSPLNGAGVSDAAHVLVKGTVSDGQTDVTVAVNGQAATIAADGTWQLTLNLSGSPSPATVSAVATDALGNSATATISIVTAAPAITLTSPASGSILATRTTNLSGSAGTATTVSINGTAAAIASGVWSITAFDLGNDGAHTLTIIGTNASGSTTITPVVTNDTTLPTVTAVVTPSPNAAGWNKSSATVSFTCSDATSGIATCPSAVTVSTETASQTVSGMATDRAGNQKAASVVVKLDTHAPLVAITSPNSGATVSSSTLSVTGTVSDTLSGVAGVTCNGATATINGGTFSCVVTLVSGDNTITTVATDVAGNTASAARQVTYNPDSQAPVITITSPANNTLTRQTTVTVSGTATDDVAVAGVTVNGTAVTLTNGTWTTTVTLTGPDGAKTITAVATDTSGKTNTATAQITLDATAPLVAITSPASGTTVINPTLSITGTVSDATSGVAGVTCNGVAASVTGGTYTCSVTLVVGSNTITAVATDNAGNTSTPAVITATYAPDTQQPTITITAPAAGTFTKETTITVSGTVSDDSSVASVTVDGAVVPFSNNAWTTTVTLSSNEGPKSITVIATDGSGNSTTAIVTITLDTTPPVIAITSPADGSSGTSATLSVAGSVNDASAGLGTVTCNGVNGIIAGGGFTCTVPLAAGANIITAVATDKAGNSATASINATFTPDTQAPVIAITAPAAGTFTKVRAVTVSGTATDDVGVSKVTVEGVEVPLSNGNWTTTVNLTGADGPRTITAVATDSTAKSTEAHVSFGLDTTGPTLVITAPPDHSSGTDSSITVTGTVSDATSGVGTDRVTCNGGNATVAGGTFTCHVTLVPGENTIVVTATDNAGNSTNATTHAVYTPDSQAPTIAIASPADNTFTRNATVTVSGTASDDVAVAKVAVNGVEVPLTNGTWTATITLTAGDGAKTITAVATDTTGKSSHADIRITLDTTPPAVTVSTPANGATVASPALTITGTVSDAGSGLNTLTCNGTAATVTSGTFTCNATLSATLLEGSNSIDVVAIDKAGNQSASALAVSLDTRSPEVVVSAPSGNGCVNGTSIQVAGRATDPHLGTVRLSITPGSASITVTPAADGTFSGSLPLAGEGKYVVAVEASDAAGHTAVAAIPLTVDRTAPAIEITSGGAAFTGGAFNHPLIINVRGIDADPAPVVTATLGGTPFASGTQVSTEGSYTLNVTAHDCAGNSRQSSVNFRIDTTGPHFSALAPATGTTVTSVTTAVTGTFDADDVTSVIVEGTPVAGTITGRNFSITPILGEGANNLVLVATDAAGNSTPFSYALNLKTSTPAVQILESGLPFPPNALYNRNVTPIIRANETAATVTATLDSAPFSSGSEVSAEGSHTIVAHASDAFGHSSDATATFSIDKTPPTLTVTAPADNAVINATTVSVTGTTTGGAVKVTINGIAVTPAADGSFASTLSLDLGANAILVSAIDAAGNGSSVTREVTRDDNRPGLVLTTPGNGMVTNHATISVAGQVLTPTFGAHVTINGSDVTPDATGAFRVDGFALHDGDNAITAAIAGNTRSSVTVHVTSDVVPPSLSVLANGHDLQPSARFATSPTIVVQATDNHPNGLTTTLTIDGIEITGPVPALADGGHVLVAIASDGAHNQTRIDRAFSVGSTTASAEGCALNSFDPPNNAAVFANAITFSGHSGGAAAVLVNGTLATIGSGSFSVSLPLNSEGANAVTVTCANANGTPTSDAPATLTIYRYTHAPSIAITSPVNDQIVSGTSVTVTGTVGANVVSGDVNGIPFTPVNGAFSVPNVSLATGLNIITAHGRNAAEQAGIATVHVVVVNGAPAITITSPIPSTQTSASTIDVSGTYTNVDRSTLTVAGVTAATVPTSDTTGSFLASIPLNSGATTITVTGRNGAGVQATATVDVHNVAGPSITIAAPADNTFYPANAAAPAAITGSISAADGSTVSVNGVGATVTGNQFTATIDFQTTASGTTPVLARVTTPDGASALDSIRLLKMPAGLTVTRSFPDANATSVDAGALVVVLFSNPLQGSTAAGAVSLADDAGHAITGRTFVDKDAISFASGVPFEAGRRYTVTISQALKDLAGQSLAAPFILNFTIATTAPGTAPIINDAGPQQGCLTSATIKGTASAAGARVRLSVDGLTTTTIAGFDKKFTFTVGLSGQPGFHIARIREVGTDGTVSPETDVAYQINCGTSTGPAVTAAALDRSTKTLTIQFSKPMNPATLTATPAGTIQLGTLSGTVAMNAANDVATVTYTGDVSGALTLTVTIGAADSSGAPLASPYIQSFPLAGQLLGNGYITGAIYDASNGRPLQGATVIITPAANGTSTTDEHGRYSTPSLGEGAFTIEASAAGFTKVWRQVVVPAGSGVVPIDIRLTSRGAEQNSGADRTLSHGGDTAVTKAAELFVPSAALSSGHKVALTAVGGQSLAGLLPLGWSPLASAEIAVDGSSIPQAIPSSRLTFTLSADDVTALTAGTQTLSLVQYDNVRDEWRTVVAAAAVTAGRVASDIQTSGNYALVYPDKGTNLVAPATPRGGTALQGVANPCGATPEVCRVSRKSFLINPPSVPPNGRATATLVTEGLDKPYPSGTAVQAYIDEQLNLADGTVSNSAPFATDLLLYRSPKGDVAGAVFHVGPSSDAAKATLRDGVDHIRVVDYPGRIDRGALIGSEGGRVPGDDTISIDIPTGATAAPLHASVVPMTAADLHDFQAPGAIPGFHVAAGFSFTLTRAEANTTTADLDGDGKPDVIPATLLKPAKGTFTIDLAMVPTANRQVLIAEVIDKSAHGSIVRLAATTVAAATPATNVKIVTTEDINPSVLPVDGIVRDGRYLVLTADAPVAYAWGQVHVGSATGSTIPGALVTSANSSSFSAPFGVRDVTRAGGIFAIPVVAQPASTFALKPRGGAVGDGSVGTAAAPAADAKVAFGALVLAPQPLHLTGITPDNTEVAVSGFHAVATFNLAIDQSSVSGGIVVTNLTTNTIVAGTVAGDGGVHVTFTPAQPLAFGSRYAIVVQPSIRSAGGASLGVAGSAGFTTPAPTPANSTFDRTKIQITIPENGIATIRGSAGALPVGEVAVAIRRNQFFVEQYQRQVGSDNTTDGSFSFNIGKSSGPDRVTIADRIDLQVQDKVSGSIVAVIPLTPFVTADGLGFIAPPDQTVTFTSAPPLSVSVTVPVGAFDTPTLVTVANAPRSTFDGVPSFDTELGFYGAINLTFDGIARKPLEIEQPVPAGTPTDGRMFMLGRLGDSSRGPRVEVDDLVTIVNGKFTTRASGTSSGQRVSRPLSVHGSNTILGNDVRNYLIHTIKMGVYCWIDIRVPTGSGVGWAAIDGLQQNLDLFWDMYHSLYVSQLYVVEGHGRVVVPIYTGAQFTVQGVDAATGIQLFEHRYDPIPVAPPGQVTGVPALAANTSGPYPVFGDPFSIQTVDVIGGIESITSVPGITIDTKAIADKGEGSVTVSFTGTATPNLPRHLRVYNVRSGVLSADSASTVSVQAKVGDRLIIYTQSDRIDPRSDLSVVFNEAIDPPVDPAAVSQADLDTAMRPLFELWKNVAPANSGADWQKVAAQTTFNIDSGNRRVLIHADLQSGAEYRLHISPTIKDTDSSPLALMQIPDGGSSSNGVDLYFAVRDPKGTFNEFTIKGNELYGPSLRDLALDGNLLFASASGGGLFAYDASDPAALSDLNKAKFAWAPALGGESLSVFVDNHGRVWTTALTTQFGVVRSFRTEDFVNKLAVNTELDTAKAVVPFAGGTVSWRTGITVGVDLGVSTTLLSDRPEATPRKLQIVNQDDTVDLTAGTTAASAPNPLGAVVSTSGGTVDGEFADYTITVPTSIAPDYPYLAQRISVHNVTAGFRWSQDGLAGPNGTHTLRFEHLLFRAGDRIRIERNMRTYGVVALFGYGIGMYDLNAIESNSLIAQWGSGISKDVPPLAYDRLGTMVGLTSNHDTLTFSPDAVVYSPPKDSDGNEMGTALTAIACMARQGVAVYSQTPKSGAALNAPKTDVGPDFSDPGAEIVSLVDIDDTLKAIKSLLDIPGNPGIPIFGRFNSIARYDVNKQVPQYDSARRVTGYAVESHSYALVSGGRYGILVLDADTPTAPRLVDLIWVPTGAWAIRYIGNNFATSIDGEGRTLLVDLSRLDESKLTPVKACPSCAAVFPTLAASLAAGSTTSNKTPFGTEDPRIVWRGTRKGANTTLAAVGDSETGFLFGGELLQKLIHTESGVDPRVTLKMNLADGLKSVSAIVPLGIQPNSTIAGPISKMTPCTTSGADVQQPTQCRENASQGVFRIEMSLPGSITNSVPGTIDVALESERIIDGLTEQTPDPLPPAHLRQYRPASGSTPPEKENRDTKFTMRRILSDSTVSSPANRALRLQKGFNRFLSPWVIAIADPRASTQYKPSGWNPADNHDDVGCFQCNTPPFLTSPSSPNVRDTDYFELYTLGRYITVRPELGSSGTSVFNGTTYSFLGDRHRVFARFPTVPADTIRAPQVLVAAQSPPVASGKIQETVYLHSGEVETSTVDLDAGGRAGWNVVFDRTYRSRTLGSTAFGTGWDSSLFARLRPLPTGHVEYRDGSGEVWLFLSAGDGTFTAPKGLFLNLVHTEQGWTLIDQKRRITYFDELGRIVRSTDEFFKPTGEGNSIRYTYDQNGRLSQVTDPVDRTTTIKYGTTQAEEGLVRKLTDWWSNAREVSYDYWTNGSLKEAHLPQFNRQSGGTVQPTRHYDYDNSAAGSYHDKIELATNLKNIIDPNEAPAGTPRVAFIYGGSVPRDYVASQAWGGSTGQVTFSFTQGTAPTAKTTDLLGQVRDYTFRMPASPVAGSKHLSYFNDRPHVDTLTEQGVEVASIPYGTLPGSAPDPAGIAVTTIARETKYGYNDDGTPKTADITNGPHNGFGYTSAGPKLGMVTKNVTTSGAGPSVSIDYDYENENTTAFLKAIKANSAVVNQSEPHRDKLSLTDANSTTTESTYDDQGRATKIAGSGGNAACTDCGAATTIKYPAQSASTKKHERGLPEHISEGANEDVKTQFTYDSEMKTTVTDARGVKTVTEYDTWHRPIDVKVSSSDTLTLEEQYDYDASGRLKEHRRMQDGVWVKTTYDYDAIGRTKSVTTDHIATDGTPTVETYDYSQYASGTIRHFSAGTSVGNGVETEITLDRLGRTKRTETKVVGAGTSNIISISAYDIAGNPVYTSDTQKFATVMAYDASGRRTDVKHTDGSAEHFDYDGFGRVKASARKANDGTTVFSRTTPYQPDGQLQTATESGPGGSRTTTRAWDGGGRTAGVAVAASGATDVRAALQQYDSAGRIQSSKSGVGTTTALSNTFTEAAWKEYGDKYLAPKVSTTEKKVTDGAEQTYESQRQFDTAGNAKTVSVGDLSWNTKFDEAGNVKTAQEPGDRGEASMKHNAAGAVTSETLADGASQSHDYYNTGSGKAFKDPGTTPETTSVTTDNLGRPLIITYEADGTTQQIRYEAARVLAVKDRQDRWQSFFYENGHLAEIWDSQLPKSGNQLDKIEHDGAGRVIHWTTPDAKIDYANFTLDGLPQSTTQTRFRNHSGLTGAPVELDRFSQTHGYNGHGERTSYSIPGGGAAPWASSVTLHYDAMGNIDSLTTDGGLSLTGDYRAAGRPNSRTITIGTKSLERKYKYKGGTGQLEEMRAAIVAGGVKTDVAGSTVAYDGLLVNDAKLIGISAGMRHTSHSYDKRGRVRGSIVGASAAGQAPPPDAAATAPGSTVETPDPADFRTGQSRAPLLDPAVSSLLQSRGIDTSKIDPPSQTSTPAPGHKIGTFTRGDSTRTFDFAGKSELVDDGLLRYHYDQKGRLDWAAGKATATGVVIRRILYTYDGNNRLVGRTAQAATVTSLTASYDTFAWNLEARKPILDADGIPAETTFVWDPVSDRIIAVVRTGDSRVANDPNNNLLKQIIHGDMGYDDPLEVTTVDTSVVVAPGQAQPVTKLYPIYDEAAGGTLQVVLNKTGEIVARSINNDPFGGAELDIAGAAIDHVEIQTKKDAAGALDFVTVTMRATEQLAAASVASGSRLAVVDANGTVVRTATTQPTLSDPYTVKWTLSATEWSALSDPSAVNNHTPVSLSIAATNTLHAALWKVDLPILPAPEWATASKPVFTSSTLPVEVRESLANIASTISALDAGESTTAVSYDVPNLGLVGTAGSAEVESLMAATFQAQPFAEPFTRKFYVRERWYDPQTGTWLSPDPLGYGASGSNLYNFAHGDPVNGRDPTGMADDDDDGVLSGVWNAVKERAKGAGRCIGLFEHYAWYQLSEDEESAGPAASYKSKCVYPLEDAFYAGPVETIGGGAERHRAGIVEAYRSGNRAETGRRSTHAVIDFLSLAAAVDGGATTGPTEAPSLAFANARATIPAASLRATNLPLVPTAVLATSPKKRTKAGVPTTQDAAGNWHDESGRFTRFRYPPKRGFAKIARAILLPGTRIDRYGPEAGAFVSPVGVPFPERSLPPSAASGPYGVYEVLAPIEVRAGPSRPWFGQPGGGMQYELPASVEDLVASGKLKHIP